MQFKEQPNDCSNIKTFSPELWTDANCTTPLCDRSPFLAFLNTPGGKLTMDNAAEAMEVSEGFRVYFFFWKSDGRKIANFRPILGLQDRFLLQCFRRRSRRCPGDDLRRQPHMDGQLPTSRVVYEICKFACFQVEELPRCLPVCPPVNLTYGMAEYSDPMMKQDSMANFTCDAGFEVAFSPKFPTGEYSLRSGVS